MSYKKILFSHYPFCIFVLAFLLSFILSLFTVVPESDISRYGSIVTSFTEGDWSMVFHPRISPLVPLIAGGIRDTKQILEQNFPVFYRYRTSNGSLGRCMITHYQVPVKIGKVTVRPGDIIFGDIDGVLCIPREIAYDVLLRAEAIQRNEVDIFDWVHSGDTIQEIIAKGGYF